MSKPINKGRDFYLKLQAQCKRLCNRVYVPAKDGDLFKLSDRYYKKVNIRNKVQKAGIDGKHELHYQTCTYVRQS